MPKFTIEPCIPTKAAKVPDRPEWIHEIKHDGYRRIVTARTSVCGCSPAAAMTGATVIRASFRPRSAPGFIVRDRWRGGAARSTALRLQRPVLAASTMPRSSSTPSTCWSTPVTISASCRCRCVKQICPGRWRAASTASASRTIRTGRDRPAPVPACLPDGAGGLVSKHRDSASSRRPL